MTIVETTRPVTGGVDTHLDVHVAAAVDANGGVLGVESFATTPAGYAELHGWLAGFGTVDRVGVEGTGAYGAGLARHLRGRGVVVIEVDRPNRQVRRRHGKSDAVDAIEAARAALSGRASGIAKSADGDVEAIRALLVARRSGRNVRIKYLNQIRHLGFTAPDELRERLRDVHRDQLAPHGRALRPTAGSDPSCTRRSSRSRTLGRRVAGARGRQPSASTTARRARAPRPRRAARRLRRRDRTPPRSCWSPRATTPTGSQAKPRSRISVASRPPASSGKTDTAPTQPRREPPSQPCAVADRVHPHEQRRTHPQIRRASHSPKDAPSARSCASSSATSPARLYPHLVRG